MIKRAILLSIAVLLAPLAADAGAGNQVEPIVRSAYLGAVLNDIALNAAAGTRTFTVGPTIGTSSNLLSYSLLVLRVAYTYANTGSISITCTEGPTGGTATYALTSCSREGGSGACQLRMGRAHTTAALTASTNWTDTFEITGAQALSCVVAHSGSPSASDKLTVTAYVASGGLTRPEVPRLGCTPVPGAATEVTATSGASAASSLLNANTLYMLRCPTEAWVRTGTTAPTAASGDFILAADTYFPLATTATVRYVGIRNTAVTGTCQLIECQ